MDDDREIESDPTLVTSVRTASDWSPPKPGTSVGEYLLLAPIGAGSTGVVYAAYHPASGRSAAVKTAGPERAAMLVREAIALGEIRHPNVVAMHDTGLACNEPWLAMEWLAGETLRAWQRASAPPWERAVGVLLDAGAGLVAAHEQGIAHGDVKPENIMVCTDGRVCLIDFGLASSAPSDRASTSPMLTRRVALPAPLGTPAYMAPELYAGAPADEGSDQFAYCVTCWETLYGQRPFAGSSAPALAYHASQGHLRAPPEGSRLPSCVRRVLERGLRVRPARRWPSMRSLLDALASCLPRACASGLDPDALALAAT